MHHFEPITSRDNRRLAELRKVRDGRDRARIFIEGKRLVEEALRSPIVIEDCFFDAGQFDGQFMERLRNRSVATYAVASKIFPSIADTESPQGIILTARRPVGSLNDIPPSAYAPVVFLSEINNPSNLGAILRTAEAAGVSGVIVSRNSADVFSPKAVRASMGSAFRLKIVEAMNLATVIDWAKPIGISAVALDIAGIRPYTDVNWSKRKLIVFGSEARGLAENDLSMIDEKVIIPMENGVESLNLAVAAGIVLFEAKRHVS